MPAAIGIKGQFWALKCSIMPLFASPVEDSRHLMRRHLFLVLVFFAAGCDVVGLDDRDPPPSEVMLGGLRWTARAETYWTAPEWLRVTMVAHNDGTDPIKVFSGGCNGVSFRVFRRDRDKAEVEAPPPLSNLPIACDDILYTLTVAPRDSLTFSTNASVPEIVRRAGTYFITAEAQLSGVGIEAPGNSSVRIPEVAAGMIELRPQLDPVPSTRVHGGVETTTTSFLRNDSVIVRVSYRNTTTSAIRVFQNTGCLIDVWGYVDRATRDHMYRSGSFPPNVIRFRGDRCDSPVGEIVQPGEVRIREHATSVERSLATVSPGTYYLGVALYVSPDNRRQSAGEVQLH